MTERFAPWLWVGLAALNGMVSVAAGAFGAHFLKSRLADQALASFETGARYQMTHALALMAAAWMISRHTSRAARASAWCFLIGIVLFSGSLYGLSLLEWRWLGPVTPLGGLAFLAGWLLLAVAAFMARNGPAPSDA